MFDYAITIISNILFIILLFLDFQNADNNRYFLLIACFQIFLITILLTYNFYHFKQSGLSKSIKIFSSISILFISYNYCISFDNILNDYTIAELYKLLICFLFVIQIYLTELKYEKYIIVSIAFYMILRGLYQKFIGFPYILSEYKNLLSAEAVGRLKDERIFSVFVMPNIFASYLIMTSGVLASYLKKNAYLKTKLLFGLLLVLLFVCLIYSKTMSAVFSGGITLVIIIVFQNRFWKIIVPVIGLMFICLALILWIRGFEKSFDNSIKYYIGNYTAALKMWKNENKFTGVGIGQFRKYYSEYKPYYANDVVYAHNYYLQTLAESGIIGFIILIAGIIYLIKITLLNDKCLLYLKFIFLFFIINNMYSVDGVILSSMIYFSYFLAIIFKKESLK